MSAYPTYTPPPKKEIEPGPASADDMVNNQTVENINDRSLQDKYRNANRGSTTTRQQRPRGGSQTSSKTDKAY